MCITHANAHACGHLRITRQIFCVPVPIGIHGIIAPTFSGAPCPECAGRAPSPFPKLIPYTSPNGPPLTLLFHNIPIPWSHPRWAEPLPAWVLAIIGQPPPSSTFLYIFPPSPQLPTDQVLLRNGSNDDGGNSAVVLPGNEISSGPVYWGQRFAAGASWGDAGPGIDALGNVDEGPPLPELAQIGWVPENWEEEWLVGEGDVHSVD